MLVRCLLAAVLALATACSFSPPGGSGGGGGGNADARPGVDATVFDADPLAPDAAPKVDIIGAGCRNGDECSARLTCLDERLGWWPTGGFCTKECAGNVDCDAGSRCMPNWDGFRVCLPDCVGGGCGAGRVCSVWLDGLFELDAPACVPGNPTAVDGAACMTFGDCAADRYCLKNQFEWPGGYCTYVDCAPGSCNGDATCVNLEVPLCLDVCNVPGDCRAAAGYDCVSGIVGGVDICVHQHESPGDPCSTPASCGGGAWDCLTGAGFPGGYCSGRRCSTAEADSCPIGMHCLDPSAAVGDEYCVKTCTTPGQCRTSEGYTCRATGGGLLGCTL